MATTAIKERPIIMSGSMVRAILEGRKTQTRRPLKPQPLDVPGRRITETSWGSWDAEASSQSWVPSRGFPGERLWVREEWATMVCYDYLEPSRLSVNSDPWLYRADGEYPEEGGRWRSPIHMPRMISRITLEITEVRVQRLLDITDRDRAAEGEMPEIPFETVWRRVYRTPGIRWDDDPWVFVYTFRRL